MRPPIQIDREKKEVIINDNRPLKRFIQSGAAERLIPVWRTLETAVASLDEVLIPLVGVLEAAFLYFTHSYDLVHNVYLSAQGSVTTSASAKLAVESP